MKDEFKKALHFVTNPEDAFEQDTEGYWPLLRWYLIVNVVLALLTPVVNYLHIPSDIVHAGTNAQMGAFVQAPILEAMTGISRYVWVAILTYVGNVAKFPLIGLIYHVIGKILGGTGTLLDSFKIGVYSCSPMLLFGWIPFFGLISGLWVGYLYVIGLVKLHEVPMGRAVAVVNFFIGIQLVWAFLFGWIGSSEPW